MDPKELIKKLKKNSRLDSTDVLDKSQFFGRKSGVKTPVPMLNVALSGRVDGGLTAGLQVIAGPSKHFKTSFVLLLTACYMKEKPNSICLFYDSEFGTPQSYFDSWGIDKSRVLHIPIKNIEELKFDLVHQLDTLDPGAEIIVVIDSVGNLASKKEIQDALDEKSVADMTRAKALKGLFRMVTPYLTMRDIPMLVVNHTYMEQGMFPKAIVSGGSGIYYSANAVWIIGRRQDKDGSEIRGYHFVVNVDKSRFVKEKSQIPISVSWKGGIMQWSGLLDVALDAGYVIKPKNGWYQAINPATKAELSKSIRESATYTKEFWEAVFTNTDFAEFLKQKFSIGEISMLDNGEEIAQEDAEEASLELDEEDS